MKSYINTIYICVKLRYHSFKMKSFHCGTPITLESRDSLLRLLKNILNLGNLNNCIYVVITRELEETLQCNLHQCKAETFFFPEDVISM